METGQMKVMGNALQKEAKIKKLENDFIQGHLIIRVRLVLLILSAGLLWGTMSSWAFLINRHWANTLPYVCFVTLGFFSAFIMALSLTKSKFLTFKVVRYPIIEGPTSVDWYVVWERIGMTWPWQKMNKKFWQVVAILSHEDLKKMKASVRDMIGRQGSHRSNYNMPYFETIIHGDGYIPTTSFYCHFKKSQYIDLILLGVFDDPAAMETKVQKVTEALRNKIAQAITDNGSPEVDWQALMTKNPEYFDTPCVRITRATFPDYMFSTGEN